MVDVLITVDVPETRPLALPEELRVLGGQESCRFVTVHPARNHLLSTRAQFAIGLVAPAHNRTYSQFLSIFACN